MGRGSNFTRAEDDCIRIGLERNKPVIEIAEYLGRGRQSVYERIKRMKANGTIKQGVLNMGQFDG